MKKIIQLLITLVFIYSCNGLNNITNKMTNGKLYDITNRLKASANDKRVRQYIKPKNIIWKSDNTTKSKIVNPKYLINSDVDQVTLGNSVNCAMFVNNGQAPGILLDFGKEIYGGIQILTGIMENKNPIKFRIRFGESASEAMSDIGGALNATNDHSMRDIIISAPWLGKIEIGNTGYRFLRIDLLDENRTVPIVGVRGVLVYRDIEYKGSFSCSDTLLNNIWETGAYTVHLCMQDYLWDGIKRDRLVWVGDMHPETMSILSVFGAHNIVPNSLDLIKNETPIPNWMNGISSYSMWWLLIQKDWYFYSGDLEYLTENKVYMIELLNHFMKFIGTDNKENLDGTRFLDWPTQADKQAVDAGLHALLIKTLKAGSELMQIMNDKNMEVKCFEAVDKLKKYVPDPRKSKQVAALLALSGLRDAKDLNDKILAVGGAKGISTFYGYYVLEAMAMAGNIQGAMDIIKIYWGGMLQMGATTFWEDFNLEWMENASRIDELPKEGEKDIHGENGKYCYVGFRHSFCHGWASGPTAWLSQYVLGIKPLKPGFKKVKIEPHLGDLQWVTGTFPTPYGKIEVEHVKKNGRIETTYTAPDEIEVVFK